MKVLLSSLKVGQTGIVKGFTRGNGNFREKLLAMGVTPGVSLKVVRYAAMGDPVEIVIRGFSLSLRRGEADTVYVERSSS